MIQKLLFASILVVGISHVCTAQSRAMYVGGVELRLGATRDATVKSLSSKYDLLPLDGSGFLIRECDQRTKNCDNLGTIAFENNQLTEISRIIDTSGWPRDEGFSVARAIYDAINSSIDTTDSDGAKRANATVVISNQDAAKPTRANIRTVNLFVNGREIHISMTDGSDGQRTVDAQVIIRSKPW